MTVEQAIVERLDETSAVTALVSMRNYTHKLPQSATFPANRVQLVSEVTAYHLRGQEQVLTARIQVDTLAEETSGDDPYAEANAVAVAVNDALSGNRAKWSSGSPPFEVVGCFRINRRVTYEADELRLVRVMQEYSVNFIDSES